MSRIELYFDYASPFSYLASESLARILPGVTVDLRPIYLRGLPTFATGVPHAASKLSYLARDLARCAEHAGIPLAPPATFPLDGLKALRAAIVAEERGLLPAFHGACFRAAWAESKDIGSADVVLPILAEALAESNVAALAEAIAAPAVKERLRAATALAAERGVFGVPTFFVGDEMFWGHDRMDHVARALQGSTR